MHEKTERQNTMHAFVHGLFTKNWRPPRTGILRKALEVLQLRVFAFFLLNRARGQVTGHLKCVALSLVQICGLNAAAHAN